MKTVDLSVKDADDFLEHLYGSLRGRRGGFSLLEPALLILRHLKETGSPLYTPHHGRFMPILLDALISGAYESFGYDGLCALSEAAGDVAFLADGYTPESIGQGLAAVRSRLAAVDASLAGNNPANGAANGVPRGAGLLHERSAAAVMLPLVSQYRVGGAALETGRVAIPRVELGITGEASMRKRHAPVVAFEHIFAEPGCLFERQIHAAIGTAERFAAESLGFGALARLPREYRVSLPEIATLPASAAAIMTGGSAGLAFTIMFLAAISRLDFGRLRLRPTEGTAFSGEIDPSGAILPTDGALIGEKVRAVFFSSCRRLVIARDNLAVAQNELARLAREHPRRRLELLPTGSVAEAVEDERIVERRRVALTRSLPQRTFLWRKHIIAGSSALAAMLISLFIAPPYINRNVASAEFRDSLIVMKNRYGRTVSTYNTKQHLEYDSSSRKYLFTGAIDGSGRRHVICALAGINLQYHGDEASVQLIVLDNRGRLARETLFSAEEIVRSLGTNTKYIGMLKSSLQVVDLDGHGNRDLLVLTNQQALPPFLMIRFSLRDSACAAFLHNGFMRSVLVHDFDRDGRRDIVLTGFNPDLDAAVVIVLDPDFIQGASPKGARVEAAGYEHDAAKYYFRLPGSRLQHRYRHPYLSLICVPIESESFFSVLSRSPGLDIVYDFDENLVCRNAHITKFREGGGAAGVFLWDNRERLDQTQFMEHIEELVAGVRYWNGEEWRSEPTRNLSYEKLAASGGRTLQHHDNK